MLCFATHLPPARAQSAVGVQQPRIHQVFQCNAADMEMAITPIPSPRVAVERTQGVYWSRSRQQLWIKGATSGAIQARRALPAVPHLTRTASPRVPTQELVRIAMDCDRDALRFIVRQVTPSRGFKHVTDSQDS